MGAFGFGFGFGLRFGWGSAAVGAGRNPKVCSVTQPIRLSAMSKMTFLARVSALAVMSATLVVGCVARHDVDNLVVRTTALEKALAEQRQMVIDAKADSEATRGRLDAALRANADASSDVLSDRARLQALGGKLDEFTHAIDELKKDLASTRLEFDARLDDLKRTQEVQSPKPPPVPIPADKGAHISAVAQAYGQKDWNLTRVLGREYLTRYPEDDKTDDVLYWMGDADLKEGRPASALGEFNRLLKQFPRSNVLGPTLFGMGESYLLLHDCVNAKLAFSACESRFPKEAVGREAKGRMARIASAAPGMCAAP